MKTQTAEGSPPASRVNELHSSNENDPLIEQYTPGPSDTPDRFEDIVLVHVSSDAAVCRLANAAMPALDPDVPVSVVPPFSKYFPEIIPPADNPTDPLAITVSDELKVIDEPANKAKSPDAPRESFA